MEGEVVTLKKNLTEWRFSQYPKYILLPIEENHDQIKANIKNVIFSEVIAYCILSYLTEFENPAFACNEPLRL